MRKRGRKSFRSAEMKLAGRSRTARLGIFIWDGERGIKNRSVFKIVVIELN